MNVYPELLEVRYNEASTEEEAMEFVRQRGHKPLSAKSCYAGWLVAAWPLDEDPE